MAVGDRRVTRRARIVWPFQTLRDLAGIALVVLIIMVAIFASVVGPSIKARLNYGFGPEWDCVNPGKGGPICVKHPTQTNNPN